MNSKKGSSVRGAKRTAEIALVLILLALVNMPAPAYAGFFSSLFEGPKVAPAEIISSNKEANAQTVSLLQSTSSPDPLSRGSDTDTAIVDNTALLPESGPLGTLADIEDGEPTSDQISIYTVRKGDTLSGIAKMFGVSVNTIIWANELAGSANVGQNLIILPVSGVRYTVKSGDTLQKIATKFKANVQEVAGFNGLAVDEKLAVGDSVIIPDGEIVSAPAAPDKKPTKSPAKPKVYNVGGPLIPGYYARPVAGGLRTQGIHGYNGVDLAGLPIGTPVVAAADGKVIISKMGGWNAGYGNYVVISHPNGTQTLYGHLSATVAHVGDQVAKGQIIGLLGNSGKVIPGPTAANPSAGAHLHFEVRGAANPFGL